MTLENFFQEELNTTIDSPEALHTCSFEYLLNFFPLLSPNVSVCSGEQQLINLLAQDNRLLVM